MEPFVYYTMVHHLHFKLFIFSIFSHKNKFFKELFFVAVDVQTQKCVVEINGQQVEKSIGEKWNKTEPCISYECERDEKGEPQEKFSQEYCYLRCYNVRTINKMCIQKYNYG